MIKQNNFSDNRRRTLASGMSEEELKEYLRMLDIRSRIGRPKPGYKGSRSRRSPSRGRTTY